jgi:hypothetical protein
MACKQAKQESDSENKGGYPQHKKWHKEDSRTEKDSCPYRFQIVHVE